MSEIDWSKAPEGTTHVGQDDLGRTMYFYRFPGVSSDYEYWNPRAPVMQWNPGKGTPSSSKLIPRPSPAWSGEGLPPVGVRCEAAIPHTSGPDNERSFIWIEGSVIAYYEIKGKTYAWFAEDDGFYPPNVLEFRPIRTPEQIAADEREAVVTYMQCIIGGCFDSQSIASPHEISEKLYEAGLRLIK